MSFFCFMEKRTLTESPSCAGGGGLSAGPPPWAPLSHAAPLWRGRTRQQPCSLKIRGSACGDPTDYSLVLGPGGQGGAQSDSVPSAGSCFSAQVANADLTFRCFRLPPAHFRARWPCASESERRKECLGATGGLTVGRKALANESITREATLGG